MTQLVKRLLESARTWVGFPGPCDKVGYGVMGLLYQHGGGTGRRQAASSAQKLASLFQMERSRSGRYFVLKSKQKQTGKKQSQRPEIANLVNEELHPKAWRCASNVRHRCPRVERLQPRAERPTWSLGILSETKKLDKASKAKPNRTKVVIILQSEGV